MSKIGKFAQDTLDTIVKKPLKWLSEIEPMDYVCKKYRANKRNFINGLGIASIVIKDGLGCYFYVNQSMNNKKIPEDKRKFVAALDLANGGLMIAMQILLFKTISNKVIQTKLFNKMFGKHFDRAAKKGYLAIVKGRDRFKNLSEEQFNKSMEGVKDTTLDAFANIASLIAATTIGKRVIVPFIATPLADRTKEWMSRNDKHVKISKETENTYSPDKPAAETYKPELKTTSGAFGSFGNLYPKSSGMKI